MGDSTFDIKQHRRLVIESHGNKQIKGVRQKMVRIENDCCSCAVPGYPCRGDSCPLRHAKHYYCDCCRVEVDLEWTKLYEYDGEELCEECLLEKVPTVKGD